MYVMQGENITYLFQYHWLDDEYDYVVIDGRD